MLNLTVHRREAVYLFACVGVSTICTFRIALDENSESSMFGQVIQTAEIGMSKVSFTRTLRAAALRQWNTRNVLPATRTYT